MEFNTLLTLSGFDPRQVAVMLHTPVQTHEKNALMAMVDDYPDLFEAYQDNHPPGPEATLKHRELAASFVVGADSEAIFVGLYRIAGWRHLTAVELDADPRRRAVNERYRGRSFADLAAESGRDGRAVFDLVPLPELADLKGRLIVRRTSGRAYMRLAENAALTILEIKRDRRFSAPPPDWRDFVVTTAELRVLPRDHAARLEGWRGVYLITDEKDGARYVGSAYGVENLLGRWIAHVAKEMGVTAELGLRDTSSFRFSILQLLLHDAGAEEVIAAENSWKDRLHTRKWGLNKN